MKYGLEQEFFLKDVEGNFVIPVPKTLPYDESGFLVESRGKPFENITDAVYSLMGETHKIIRKLPVGFSLDISPFAAINKAQKFAVRREFSKGTNNYQNLYGYEYHKTSQNEHTAGIHISFTREESVYIPNSTPRVVNAMFDFVQLFRYLDKQFSSEIKDAKRRPGFYEIKSDGRIEYRSLPSNTSLDKIIEVISEYKGA